MKKLTAMVIAGLIVFTSIPGLAMASEADITGTWYAQTMENDGQTMDASIMSSMGFGITAEFNEDGTATISMGNQVIEGTWADGIFSGNGQEMPIEMADGNLEMENGGARIIFGREAPKGYDATLAPAVESPALSDFNGIWDAEVYVALGIPLPLSVTGTQLRMEIRDGSVAYTELLSDLNNGNELTDTIEKEFQATLEDDGTLFVDFNGEKVLSVLIPGASGIRLTLHEDGRMSGEIPELTEAMEQYAALSSGSENTGAEAAGEGDSSGDSEGVSSGASSGEGSLSAYLIFKAAE